jgi:hypothetical protein
MELENKKPKAIKMGWIKDEMTKDDTMALLLKL